MACTTRYQSYLLYFLFSSIIPISRSTIDYLSYCCPMVYRSSCFLHLSASLHNPPHATGQVSTNHSSQFALPPNQPPLSTPALPRSDPQPTHRPPPTSHPPSTPNPSHLFLDFRPLHIYPTLLPSSLFLPSLFPQKTPPQQTSIQPIPPTDFDIVCALLPSFLHRGQRIAYCVFFLVAVYRPGIWRYTRHPPSPPSRQSFFFYPTVYPTVEQKLPVPRLLVIPDIHNQRSRLLQQKGPNTNSGSSPFESLHTRFLTHQAFPRLRLSLHYSIFPDCLDLPVWIPFSYSRWTGKEGTDCRLYTTDHTRLILSRQILLDQSAHPSGLHLSSLHSLTNHQNVATSRDVFRARHRYR